MKGMNVQKEGRLILLRTLSEQPAGRMNSSLLRDELDDRWGLAMTRDWVHAELRWLEMVGAVTVFAAETVLIATITARGLDHVERRIVIDGVKRPSPEA